MAGLVDARAARACRAPVPDRRHSDRAAQPARVLCWLAIPMMRLGARFSERGIAAGLALSLVLLLGVALVADAQTVFENPPLLFGPLALMACVGIFQSVLMRSDVKYRAAAVIDPLTGMLNRQALAGRPMMGCRRSIRTGVAGPGASCGA
jgi:hypothetical protein